MGVEQVKVEFKVKITQVCILYTTYTIKYQISDIKDKEVQYNLQLVQVCRERIIKVLEFTGLHNHNTRLPRPIFSVCTWPPR